MNLNFDSSYFGGVSVGMESFGMIQGYVEEDGSAKDLICAGKAYAQLDFRQLNR